jgi:D-3-phosphoglycerate dehydrogenase
MTRPLVIQCEELDAAAAAWLRETCELVVCPLAEARAGELLARAEGLVVRTYTRAGVGLDRIDVAECRRRGVEVVHTPDANSSAVAEFVFVLLADALRPRVRLDRAVPMEQWSALRRSHEAPAQFGELTLGVLGLGRVGSRVARLGHGLGMEVLYHDLRRIAPAQRQGAQPVTLEELARRSDVLSIHIDNRPGNRGFLNAALLAQLRASVIVVNTSRGMVVDAGALAAFLRQHPGARALLDVHEPEPFPEHYPLLGLPNAVLTPHLAASTATAHVNMSWVVKDVQRVLFGKAPKHPAP